MNFWLERSSEKSPNSGTSWQHLRRLGAKLIKVPYAFEAMVELAQDLREGRGGPRDLAAARAWLLRASEAGAPNAKTLLDEVDAQLRDRHSERGV